MGLFKGSIGRSKVQRGSLTNREIGALQGGRWYHLSIARLRQQLDA
jgi:hypothetical protein